jgi:mannose-1-phosphate guanylyltransferase
MQLGTFGWADMGRWDDVYRYSSKDADGNVVTSGRVEFYNCKNNLVSANNKLVILQDLEGYLVNDTVDVLVICKKDEDDDFKKFRNSMLLKHGESYM